MAQIGVGLIGTGFMGKCHALAFGAVRAVFGDVPEPRLELLCDVPAEAAGAMAGQLGFARSTDDWRALVGDPRVDLVAITTPNNLHREMAVAALQAGKHVYCEKPLAITLEDARAMAAAAREAGVVTQVGYNYVKNPALEHARALVESGAIGRVIQFRGTYDEDYMADPAVPWTWRCRRETGGLGTLGDLGCHLVSVAEYLVGPIASVCADTEIAHRTRPLPDGSGTGEVENEDIASALLRFEDGTPGLFSSSRCGWGRKCALGWELQGERGAIGFDQERMNELRLYTLDDPPATRGFRTILTGPAHGDYAAFCPAPGHGLGFNDQKVIEVARLLRAIAGGAPAWPDMEAALGIEQVIHAIDRSARARAWVEVRAA